jgi:hypothetical protein
MCQRERTDVPDGWTDRWTGTVVSGAVGGEPSRASDGKASGADLAGRAKAARKAAGAGVPLTSPPLWNTVS